ncbi:hypothetical protein pipiens_013972, partial [Culex pipiens pipiens]
AAEIFKYPTFDAFVKPPSHCPYHLFMEFNQASEARKLSTTKALILLLVVFFVRRFC